MSDDNSMPSNNSGSPLTRILVEAGGGTNTLLVHRETLEAHGIDDAQTILDIATPKYERVGVVMGHVAKIKRAARKSLNFGDGPTTSNVATVPPSNQENLAAPSASLASQAASPMTDSASNSDRGITRPPSLQDDLDAIRRVLAMTRFYDTYFIGRNFASEHPNLIAMSLLIWCENEARTDAEAAIKLSDMKSILERQGRMPTMQIIRDIVDKAILFYRQVEPKKRNQLEPSKRKQMEETEVHPMLGSNLLQEGISPDIFEYVVSKYNADLDKVLESVETPPASDEDSSAKKKPRTDGGKKGASGNV